LVGEVDPEHQATLTVLRGGREQNITVTIGKRPMPEFNNGNFQINMPDMGNMKLPDLKSLPQMQNLPDFQNMPDLQNMPNGQFRSFSLPDGQGWAWSSVPGGRQIGIGITPLTKQLAEHFRVDSGVMVTEVRENTPAAKAGLRAGDIILKAGGRTVMNQADLMRALDEKKDGDIQLTIDRNGSRQTISVTPEPAKGGNSLFQTTDDSD
jgi:hypothetical protein